MQRFKSKKFILGFLLTAFYLCVMVVSLPGIGLTDDVDFYARASLRYSEWFGRAANDLAHFKTDAFRSNVSDQYWGDNREHPPFAKLVMGFTHSIFHNLLGVAGTIDGLRLGTILLSTLLALMLFLLAYEEIGVAASVFAPLALLTMPRFFFHSHAETLDVPVAATFFLSFFAFWKAQRSWRWALFAGVAFGFALSTKLNAPFLLVMLVLWWLVKNASEFGWEKTKGLVIPAIPLWLPSMVFIGFFVFFVMWPWLWFDTFQRLGGYMGFHLKHYGILFSYFGKIYDTPFAPWHAPWVMAGITTPPLTLVLALFGIVLSLLAIVGARHALPFEVRRTQEGGRPGEGQPQGVAPTSFISGHENASIDRARDFKTLLLLGCLFTIGPVSFLGTPKYGGVKLFLPFFPFLILLGGISVQWLADCSVRALKAAQKPVLTNVLAIGIPVLLVLPAGVSLARVHPYHLSYYNAVIGGLEGAANAGMERQYYDIFYRGLVDWMNKDLPEYAAVTFLPNNKEYVRSGPWYKRDGILRNDIRLVDLSQAQYLVLTHEERWPEWPSLKNQYSKYPVIHEIKVEGVPLLTVYKLK